MTLETAKAARRPKGHGRPRGEEVYHHKIRTVPLSRRRIPEAIRPRARRSARADNPGKTVLSLATTTLEPLQMPFRTGGWYGADRLARLTL